MREMAPPAIVNPLDIVSASEDLTSGFLLWTSARSLSPSEAASARNFLLWRTAYATALGYSRVLDEATLSLIAQPDPPYLTALESYVARIAGRAPSSNRAILETHKWYYTEAVRQHDLWAVLTVAEMLALAQLPSLIESASELRLFDEVICENHLHAREAFDLTGFAGRAGYLAWRRSASFAECASWFPIEDGRLEQQFGVNVQSSEAAHSLSRSRPLAGINLIGYANAVLGLREDMASLRAACRRAGVRTQIVNVPISPIVGSVKAEASRRDEATHPFFPVNLFCVPLSETERYRLRHPDHVSQATYNIGHWAWELSSLPPYWRHAFRYIDEIWTVSPYCVRTFQQLSDKPVHYVPPLVQVEEVAGFDLADIGVEPGAFVFLTFCDLNSYVARKNPQGAIEAFRLAFSSTGSNERLIVKTLNGHANAREFNKLLQQAGDDPRIIVVDGPYLRAQALGLIHAADCLLSLHRAEGFGRVLAEALLLETTVIATGYSGSTVFLDQTTGFPVGYDIVPVGHDEYCFAEGSVWAEPRLEHAASQMQRVVRDRAEAVLRTRAGRLRVAENHGLPSVAQAVRERFNHIADV